MNVNPNEYDPAELRRTATDPTPGESTPTPERRPDTNGHESGTNGRGGHADAFRFDDADRKRPDESLRSTQLEELFMHQTANGEVAADKPYLSRLPDEYAAERVIFDWLEFLVLKTGFKRSFRALRFYRNIDWITEDVEDDLQEYLLGFSAEGEHTRDLVLDDHQLSLVYLAKLAAMA